MRRTTIRVTSRSPLSRADVAALRDRERRAAMARERKTANKAKATMAEDMIQRAQYQHAGPAFRARADAASRRIERKEHQIKTAEQAIRIIAGLDPLPDHTKAIMLLGIAADTVMAERGFDRRAANPLVSMICNAIDDGRIVPPETLIQAKAIVHRQIESDKVSIKGRNVTIEAEYTIK